MLFKGWYSNSKFLYYVSVNLNSFHFKLKLTSHFIRNLKMVEIYYQLSICYVKFLKCLLVVAALKVIVTISGRFLNFLLRIVLISFFLPSTLLFMTYDLFCITNEMLMFTLILSVVHWIFFSSFPPFQIHICIIILTYF